MLMTADPMDIDDDDMVRSCRRCRRPVDDVGWVCRACQSAVAAVAAEVRRLRADADRLRVHATRLPVGLTQAAYLIAATRLVAQAVQLGRQLPVDDDDDVLPTSRTVSADSHLLTLLMVRSPFMAADVVHDPTVRSALSNCLTEVTARGLSGILREAMKRTSPDCVVEHLGDGQWTVTTTSMLGQPRVDAA